MTTTILVEVYDITAIILFKKYCQLNFKMTKMALVVIGMWAKQAPNFHVTIVTCNIV